MQNLSSFHVNKLISLNHADDSMVNSLSIFIALHHFLMKFRVRNLGSNGDTSLNGLFDLADHGNKLDGSLDGLSSHATLSGVKC